MKEKRFPIFGKIKELLPANAQISDYLFEGANIVLYTKNKNLFLEGSDLTRKIVNTIKKRVEFRIDPSLLLGVEPTEEFIRKIIPKEAGLRDVFFDNQRSFVIVESENPGSASGRGGEVLEEIKRNTLWIPRMIRVPAIKSDIVRTIRRSLFEQSDYRRKFLNSIGEKIYSRWTRDNKKYWIRLSALGGFREVGRSCMLLQTPQSKVMMDCGVNVASEDYGFPHLEVPEFNIDELDAVIITHSHLDHCGFLPYLFKFGYKGPIYCTEPTRDVMTLLQLDYIDVAQKEGKKIIYTSKEIKGLVHNTICLKYGEVSDITPDIRITLLNAGHILGSSMIHLNIGNGYHNLLYSGDIKYANSTMLDPAHTYFQRLETLILESTYGGRNSFQPSLEESEKKLLDLTNKTIERGGKILIPVLGVGRAQEIMLILEKAFREKKIKPVKIFVDGMVWDVTAISTTYPEFMNKEVRRLVFQKNHNPFLSEIFNRVGSNKERTKIIEEEGPCIILATSGMLTGGPSVTYLNRLCDNKDNSLLFVSYQSEGSLGRDLQKGIREIPIPKGNRTELMRVKLEVDTLEGFSGHSDRQQLINFVKHLRPRPRRVILDHGESSKCLDLSSSLHNTFRIETTAPRVLDVVRIK